MPYYSRIILNSFYNRLFPKLFRHNRRMPIPYPKGPLSDHLPTASIAEGNKEVLKAVEAKEPQKKGPYIKFTPEYKEKVAS